MNFETSVRIERPVDVVFDYVADPRNFPRWNSAVEAVRQTSPRTDGDGATYSMVRELPGGRAENDLEVRALRRPTEFDIRTTSGPTPFVYRYRFTDEGARRSWSSPPRWSLAVLPARSAP